MLFLLSQEYIIRIQRGVSAENSWQVNTLLLHSNQGVFLDLNIIYGTLCVCVCDAGGPALQRLRSPEQQPDGELHIRQVCLRSVTITLDVYVPTHRNQLTRGLIS